MSSLDGDRACESFGAIVVGAGRSLRLGQDKLFVELAGRPVIEWSLRAFELCASILTVALVLSESNHAAGRALVRDRGLAKVRTICLGGTRREDSVLAGLTALGPHDWVAVHDGARPLVTPELIERGLSARRTGAAIPGVPLKDTVKVVRDGAVSETPDRSCLRAIQTPQVFRYELLLDAYRSTCSDVTDDAALLEALGHPVVVFPGEYDNVKITTADDLVVAEALIGRRSGVS